MPRTLLVASGLGLAALSAAAAQAPARPDTLLRSDTVRLQPLEVQVTRSGEAAGRLPMAVGVLDRERIRRAQATIGLDESLSRLPGVVVLNRSNFSLDQRVSLRGAGSRANFGLRGVKVLLDGVPQTLPDGQSQLTNLELGVVDRVEVLTGPAGALYGNAAGGALAFTTEAPGAPFQARARAVAGSFGTSKWQGVVGGVEGRASGLVSFSRFRTDGFRQHSAAEASQLFLRVDYHLGERSTIGARFAAADAPRAENPGALTPAEYAATRDSAAGANILRGADKALTQQQLSLRYRWLDGTGAEVEVTAFGLARDLTNPLATAPPAPVTATAGTWNAIARVAGGVRLAGTVPLRRGPGAFRVTAGLDLQAMRDNRRNERSAGGQPTGQVLADQRETVTELGPFAQLHWMPAPRVAVLGAVRYDRLAFRVRDRFLTDGVDNSGERVMENVSGSAGVSVEASGSATLYANAATSFESPTTTELVNTSNGTVGFNGSLGPQRTVSVEAGARARLGAWGRASVAVFASGIRDAIIQAREQDGRAYFQNAGRVRNRGVEAGLEAAPLRWLRLQAAYAYAAYTFSRYHIPNGATTDTLDGKRLAGVPRHFVRASALGSFGALQVELEQVSASDVYGDDRNTLHVDGWGTGVTNLRMSGDFGWGALRLAPFAAANNLFDRRYVGSVNINGFGGRILEPAPGRGFLIGAEVRWR